MTSKVIFQHTLPLCWTEGLKVFKIYWYYSQALRNITAAVILLKLADSPILACHIHVKDSGDSYWVRCRSVAAAARHKKGLLAYVLFSLLCSLLSTKSWTLFWQMRLWPFVCLWFLLLVVFRWPPGNSHTWKSHSNMTKRLWLSRGDFH